MAKKPALTVIPDDDFFRVPADLSDDDRKLFQDLCDLIEKHVGLSQPDILMIESVVRDHRLEMDSRTLAAAALDENNLDAWKMFVTVASRASNAKRANLKTLRLTADERSGKVAKQLKGARTAERSEKWSQILAKKI